ncbi:hypothetical protein GCM10023350_36750 [Nocardioides endophyticus]|uniref:Uncharacterized protein n=1 Tax=Nocardioides endophyticus TaxID=1353775 RepID=A0ABP8Z7B9_9ACTN
MDLDKDERAQLAGTLGCTEADLDSELQSFFDAAQEEYVRMMLGQRVYTRGSDIREYRLLLLIKHAFKKLPSEQQISGLFQTSAIQSRSLLRSVMSKYQYELQAIIRDSLSQLLTAATGPADGDKVVIVEAENFVEALNREIAAIDGRLQPVTRQASTTAAYVIPKDTYKRLETRFGVAGG